ncbi:MAG: PPC domain-containing protein, partial [Alphaproteobacteria bacterium]|nr:PPC domain-containing protein [Alphaproteobacteria bacterium]
DVDWFAVELVAGRTYVIDLEGAPGGGGTLGNAMLRGLYDAEGQRIAGTRNDDGGEGADARLTFTATESGTHYIAARSSGPDTGSYTVRVTAFVDPDATAAGATDLGDLAALDGERVHRETVDGGPDGTDYYRFTLGEARTVKLALRYQDADADLHLEDADGNVLHSSTRGGTRNERIEAPLEAETYYVRVVAREEGENAYTLRYRAEEPEAPAPPEPDPLPRAGGNQPSAATGRRADQRLGTAWGGLFGRHLDPGTGSGRRFGYGRNRRRLRIRPRP